MAFGFKHGSKNLIKFIAKPTVTGAFTFDNTKKAATISGYDSKAMVISGTREATSSGTYTITFTLNKGYAWEDKSKDPVNRTWSIAKRVITIPTMTNTSYTWAVNTTFKPTISGVDTNYVTQSGTTSSVNAGSWTVTWALRFPNDTKWTDNATANKTASWSVAKLTLTAPSISGTKSFAFVEGTTRSVSVANYNSTYETQSGTTSTSAQGSYTITWALRYPANTQWSGGTTANKTDTWSITWVNGTSHYNSDLYNKGWLKSNSLQTTTNGTTGTVNAEVVWGTDSLILRDAKVKTADWWQGKTVHFTARVKMYSGTQTLPRNFYIYEYKTGSDWGRTTNATFNTLDQTYREFSGTNTLTYERHLGTAGGNAGTNMSYYWGLEIQRIWVT